MATQISKQVFWHSYAAFSKLANITEFEWLMLNQPLPQVINKSLVWFIPSAEIITICFLVIPVLRQVGLVNGINDVVYGLRRYL